MYVRAGRPAFARPYVGVHKSTSLMSSDKISSGFEIQMDPPIKAKRLDLVLVNKNKRTCHLVDFAVATGYRMKVNEGEKLNWTKPESCET